MKSLYEVLIFVIIALILIVLAWAHDRQNLQIEQLQRRVTTLDSENAGQWKRISELEKMFCNPKLIKCGK